ncbi:MAG TPA: 23S rRNA (pseudouridine(1915)-N(3))-methyltransferase RlmH [Acidobacterium sp.]|nr:23S rRNA (pseudouridine(1915)-N(3))-methyltransferase RlmH [Acidobacterium sp.]
MAVKILLASVGNRARRDAFDTLAELYLGRVRGYCDLETAVYRTEEAFLEAMERQQGRVAPLLALLDSRGKLFSSEQLAAWVGEQREAGQQWLVFAVGPADGWSDAARRRARLLLSLGPMTLPHELARVVVSEQIYRAFTILAGHPYHSGH